MSLSLSVKCHISGDSPGDIEHIVFPLSTDRTDKAALMGRRVPKVAINIKLQLHKSNCPARLY